ncbi:hypothetical protein [Nocardioides renjunii]|uniref:hypothetical protein n=1 Tax=Nocardioides renjunii TaxID=3095075 RepID=UPI002AFE4713|nr:hypothetical protein [Nocardioides sp. S-34]WQQ24347.1 hypothetical protein SHK17_10230 [Nocardioides sp. S-34]
MSTLVMMLLVVQVVGGAYLFGAVSTAGASFSTARATRLPPLLVFGHAMLGLAAPTLWIGWMVTRADPMVWVTLGSLLLSIAGGLVMLSRTAGHSTTLERPATDPADVAVVEKQIPKPVLAGHGLLAAVLVACVVAVGLGV